MAFAINITTESCDHYLIVLGKKPTKEQIIKKVKEKLGDEIYHISEINIESNYKLDNDFINDVKKDLYSFGE